jgi:hypothetical protein
MPKPSSAPKHDPMSGVVDRLLAQLPGLQGEAPTSHAPPRFRAAGIASTTSSSSGEDLLGPWARFLLGLTLGTMIAWWPYPRSCGFPLAGYLGALATITVAGGWAAVSSWRYRAKLAHILSLILVFYGLMMGVAELLPRTGYSINRATWECVEPLAGPSMVSASLGLP